MTQNVNCIHRPEIPGSKNKKLLAVIFCSLETQSFTPLHPVYKMVMTSHCSCPVVRVGIPVTGFLNHHYVSGHGVVVTQPLGSELEANARVQHLLTILFHFHLVSIPCLLVALSVTCTKYQTKSLADKTPSFLFSGGAPPPPTKGKRLKKNIKFLNSY